MSAYWNLPDASAECLRDGWLDTGDIGYLDDEGFLRVTGRIKDLINRGGEKISAAEIEACICEMPGIEEAAAFAITDRYWARRWHWRYMALPRRCRLQSKSVHSSPNVWPLTKCRRGSTGYSNPCHAMPPARCSRRNCKKNWACKPFLSLSGRCWRR